MYKDDYALFICFLLCLIHSYKVFIYKLEYANYKPSIINSINKCGRKIYIFKDKF